MGPRLDILTLLIGLGAILSCGDSDTPENDTQESGASGVYESAEGVVFDLGFEPDPPQAGEVELVMDISVDDQPLEEAEIEVEPWMPAHGHGSNTEAVVHEVRDGVYDVEDLTFSMPGHWELTIDLQAPEMTSTLVVDLDVEG